MEWIRVKEIVPSEDLRKKETIVLVCDIDGNVNVAWLSKNNSNFLDEWRGYKIENVAYWMQLPLPPPSIQLEEFTLPPINLPSIGKAK